jgi:hypothetical protein
VVMAGVVWRTAFSALTENSHSLIRKWHGARAHIREQLSIPLPISRNESGVLSFVVERG